MIKLKVTDEMMDRMARVGSEPTWKTLEGILNIVERDLNNAMISSADYGPGEVVRRGCAEIEAS